MAQEPNEVGRDPLLDAGSTATAPSPSTTTTEIRKQIEYTRAEMSETIDAIQERLSPTRLVNDAKESVKDATVARVKRLTEAANRTFGNGSSASNARRIADAVKANPMPFAIAGVAGAALIARALTRRAAVGSYKRRRFFARACGASLGCFGAWSAIRAARTGALNRPREASVSSDVAHFD